MRSCWRESGSGFGSGSDNESKEEASVRGVRGGGWKGEAVRTGVKTPGVLEVLLLMGLCMLPEEDSEDEELSVKRR